MSPSCGKRPNPLHQRLEQQYFYEQSFTNVLALPVNTNRPNALFLQGNFNSNSQKQTDYMAGRLQGTVDLCGARRGHAGLQFIRNSSTAHKGVQLQTLKLADSSVEVLNTLFLRTASMAHVCYLITDAPIRALPDNNNARWQVPSANGTKLT